MSQNDFTIANQGFPAFRADLNSALQALASNSSGATAPSTTFSNMWWYDSANNIMYIRNEDNDAWIKFAELDQANDKFVLSGTLQLDDGSASAPALTFNSDTNMGIYRGGTDILKFVTAGTDAVTIDASQDVTLAGSLNFADSEKAIFGAGSDLQIYHDGLNSYIKDNGTGSLVLEGQDLYLNSTVGTYLRGVEGGAVTIFHNDSTKLTTTSTGIDVTGTATMDGLTVDGSVSVNTSGAGVITAGSDTSYFGVFPSGTYPAQFYLSGANRTGLESVAVLGSKSFQVKNHILNKNIATFDGTTGDISFYEDTGTTPKFFWDASTERLGIGTSSPTYKIESSGSSNMLKLVNGTTYDLRFVEQNSLSNIYSYGSLDLSINTRYSNNIRFKTNDTERMRIDSAGHVTMPYQSAFQARPTSIITNIATETVIAMSNEIFDQNSDYNTSTYTFTAPVTGKYQFNVAIRIDSVDSDSNWQRITLDTSNHTYGNSIIDLDGLSADPVHWGISYSVLADMDAGDTALIRWWQSGGSTQADIDPSSYFSGYLVA